MRDYRDALRRLLAGEPVARRRGALAARRAHGVLDRRVCRSTRPRTGPNAQARGSRWRDGRAAVRRLAPWNPAGRCLARAPDGFDDAGSTTPGAPRPGCRKAVFIYSLCGVRGKLVPPPTASRPRQTCASSSPSLFRSRGHARNRLETCRSITRRSSMRSRAGPRGAARLLPDDATAVCCVVRLLTPLEAAIGSPHISRSVLDAPIDRGFRQRRGSALSRSRSCATSPGR